MDLQQMRQGMRSAVKPAGPKLTGPKLASTALPTWWREGLMGLGAVLVVILVAFILLAPAKHGAVVAAAAAPVNPDIAEANGPPTGAPLLWVMKDADTTIYLFGSVHILRQKLNWMDARLFKAFDSADEAWFEVPDLDHLPAFKGFSGTVFAAKPVLLNGLSDTEKNQLKILMARYNYTLDDVARVKPAAMAQFVQQLDQMGGGFSIQRGADFTLFHRARDMKKKTGGFESYREHYGYLYQMQALGDDGTDDLKDALAAHFGTGSSDSDINVMVKYWRNGDQKAITDVVARQKADEPRVNDILLVQRNQKWLPRIETMMQTKGTVFITVGAAHLVGPDGLVAQLRARGHVVTRLDPGKA